MSAGPNTLDIAEQLSKLAKLHADGAITDDEFASLKAKLLASNSPFKYRYERSRVAEGRKGETANIADWASWCLAFVPVISVPANAFILMLFGTAGGSILIYLTPVCLWLLFLLIDRDIIKKAGEDPGETARDIAGVVLLAAVFVPVYLYQRSKRLRKPLSSFYVCVAIMIVWLIIILQQV